MIHVVAGVLYDADDRVLIAQRPLGSHLAGGWEFPGGKLEPGETPRHGLARELKEELGVTIATPRPLLRLLHTYPYGEVRLDVWVVRHYLGMPQGLDGQALRWCRQDELEATTLLPADGPVVAALRLPEVLRQPCGEGYEVIGVGALSGSAAVAQFPQAVRMWGALCENLEQARVAAAAGASFLALGAPLTDQAVRDLCEAVSQPVFVRGTSLLTAWSLGASGLNDLGG